MPLLTRHPVGSFPAVRFPVIHCAVLFSLTCCAPGCGPSRPDRVPVSGQVMLDGKPLTGGQVRFIPDDARPSYGEIDENGAFTLTCFDGADGAVPGSHRVEVIAVEELSATQMRWLAPKKYSKFETSGLTAQIDGPVLDLRLELTWDGGQPYVEKFGG